LEHMEERKREREREREMHTGLWWENLTDRDHSEYAGIIGNIILK